MQGKGSCEVLSASTKGYKSKKPELGWFLWFVVTFVVRYEVRVDGLAFS